MVGRALARAPEDPGTFPPATHLDAIDRRFRLGYVEGIFAALENKGTDWVSDTLKNLRHMSPTCLQDELEAHESGAKLSFADAMTMEYGMSRAFIPSRDQPGPGRNGGEAIPYANSAAFPLAEKVVLDHQKLFDISSISSGRCWPWTEPLSDAGTHSGIARQSGLSARFNCGDDVEGSEACLAKRRKIQGQQRPWERKLRRFTRCSPIMAAASWVFRRLSRCFAERVELTYYLRGSASF